jgi:DNA ligase D-like protein (predicted 3'-phosphoesterase)
MRRAGACSMAYPTVPIGRATTHPGRGPPPRCMIGGMVRDDSLEVYRTKRDFRRTPEPSGKRRRRNRRPIFVIQKHAATRLHYDLRIEVGDVLKSWAVPKGPSTDPRQRRLAVATEDHPMDYADFEGVIPEGEYGGGTVMVWDKGTYENIREEGGSIVPMEECINDGHIAIRLRGKKLQGGYGLVRTARGDRAQWLLIKMKDDKADARRNPVSTQPDSAITGRTLKQIEEQEKA